MRFFVQLRLVLVAVLSLAACVAQEPITRYERLGDHSSLLIPGISGMAWAGESSLLTVQDAKIFEPDEPRIGLLTIDKTNEELRYRPLTFPANATSLSNDLEGICRAPNRPGEFLLSESGYWNKHYGRIFHVSIAGSHVELIRELSLPLIRDNNENQRDGDQFEGIACTELTRNEVLVILGERGGTSVYPNGVLRWGSYDLSAGNIRWSENSIPIKAPNPWSTPTLRSITSLTIDTNNHLWASAAEDSGDLGPFRSVVYQIGTVSKRTDQPISVAKNPEVLVVEGFKVEGVSAGTETSDLSIGTEDEAFGGNWRNLAPIKR
ncbi:MAG: hypothetical protein AAF385_12470 [Pseudomonadota bacterium]